MDKTTDTVPSRTKRRHIESITMNRTTAITMALLLSACGGGDAKLRTAPVTVVTDNITSPPPPTTTPPSIMVPARPVPASQDEDAPCDGFATSGDSYAIGASIVSMHADRSGTMADAYIFSVTDIAVENFSSGLRFMFDARTKAASTVMRETTLYAFAGTDMIDASPSMTSYRNGMNELLVSCEPGSSIAFQRFAADVGNPAPGVRESSYRAQLTGPQTATTAETSSGTYMSSLPMEIFRTDVVDPLRRNEAVRNTEPFMLTFDKAAGTIVGKFRTDGSEPVDVSIAITRQIGTRFTGVISASDGARGEISGGFYGPGGREIGFVTAFEKFGSHYAGAGSGVRG